MLAVECGPEFSAFIIGGGDPFFDPPTHCSHELRDEGIVTSLDEVGESTVPPSAGLDLLKFSCLLVNLAMDGVQHDQFMLLVLLDQSMATMVGASTG